MRRVEASGGFFSGGLRKLTLTVPDAMPGSQIEVEVELDVAGEVRGATAEVWVRFSEHTRIRQGDYTLHEVLVLDEQRYPLALPDTITAPFKTTLEVRVPSDAAPAMPGALVNEVHAEVRRRWRPMLAAKTALVVLPPSMAKLVQPAPSPLDADLEVWAEVREQVFRQGDTVSGVVKIMPVTKAQHARAAVVRLTALAHNWGEDHHLSVAEAPLATGPFEEERVIPFSLTLPVNAPLTYRGRKLDIDWYVEAELLDTPGINPRSHTPFVVG